ncbi:proton-coupled zinc antiporter SLC30A2-like isoform X2 [Lineus longissimus]|uniref:proton-coupled zinc antiporter SLC30A2-like isoform X2 n=1 Tax=Lineus longissimus TaxID=88925 RepID=UPI00315C8ACE
MDSEFKTSVEASGKSTKGSRKGSTARRDSGRINPFNVQVEDLESQPLLNRSTNAKLEASNEEFRTRSGTGIQTTDYRSIGSPNSSDEDDETGNHCHRREKSTEVDNKARNKLIIASILCLIFMCGEAVGGALARSLAVVTDAAHLLTDFASFMISLLAIYLASRPATKKMSFGWYRAEVMGALVSVLMIWVVTGILVYMAVLRVINEDYEIDAKIMLITAAVGVMFNIVMGCTLHQHGHTHGGGHGHSHGGLSTTSSASDLEAGNNSDEAVSDISGDSKCSKDSQKKRKKEQNINVKAAFIHVIGDFVQSLGVLIAAFIIYFKPEWKIADPICTFLFSVLVLITTINILRDTLHVLMEGAPQGLDFNEVKQSFFEIKGVKEVHNLRMWSLTIDKAALSVHLAIDKKHNSQEVLKQASRMVRQRFNIHDVTLQVEEYCDTMEACDDCKDPTD